MDSSNVGSGAAAGAGQASRLCLVGPLALTLACLPIALTVGAAVGAVAGAAEDGSRRQLQQEMVAKQESPRRAFMGRISAAVGGHPDLRLSLLERTQRHALAYGLGDLALLIDQSTQSISDWSSSTAYVDFVIEIAVTNIELKETVFPSGPAYWLQFNGRASVRRTKDSAVVESVDVTAMTQSAVTTRLVNVEEWTKHHSAELAKEIEETLDRLAKEFVDTLIRPAL